MGLEFQEFASVMNNYENASLSESVVEVVEHQIQESPRGWYSWLTVKHEWDMLRNGQFWCRRSAIYLVEFVVERSGERRCMLSEAPYQFTYPWTRKRGQVKLTPCLWARIIVSLMLGTFQTELQECELCAKMYQPRIPEHISNPNGYGFPNLLV